MKRVNQRPLEKKKKQKMRSEELKMGTFFLKGWENRVDFFLHLCHELIWHINM